MLLPLDSLVKASIPRTLFAEEDALPGAVDSFRRLVAAGMAEGYNCGRNYDRSL